jgi:hypothetical protein
MAKRKPKTSIKLQVNEEMWTCQLWPAKVYEKLHGNDSNAITDIEECTIDFRDDAVTLAICGHELMHAYFKNLHLDSVVQPKIEDVEEIIASWIGANFVKFYHKANLIYSALEPYKLEAK